MEGGIELLKKGFAALQKHVDKRKATLQDRLKKDERINDDDSAWLDGPANLIDEGRALELLDSASDYEQGLSRLNDVLQAAVNRMKEFAFTSLYPCSALEEPAEKPIIPAGKTPGKKKTVKAIFTHAENATHEQRIEILDWYHGNGRNQTRTAKHFDPKYPNLRLKQPKIAEWVKNECRYRELHAASVTKNGKRMRQTQHPEVTEMLELWVEQAMRDKIHVSGEVLRQKWTEFAVLCGVPEDDRLALSEGWLSRLKARLGLREFKRHGEAASASPEAVEAERKRVQELIQKGGFRVHNI